MGRIIAIDYGTKRTGLAVSDPGQVIAGPLDTVATHTLIAFMKNYISSNPVDTIVIGLPTQADGSPSDTYPHVVGLIRTLEKEFPGIRIQTFDERFTSLLAQRAIRDAGARLKQRRDKALVDKVSATIILQGYMESRQRSEGTE